MGIQESLKELSKRSSKGVSSQFRGSFKDVLRKFQGRLKEVSNVFKENFQWCFKNVSMKNKILVALKSKPIALS